MDIQIITSFIKTLPYFVLLIVPFRKNMSHPVTHATILGTHVTMLAAVISLICWFCSDFFQKNLGPTGPAKLASSVFFLIITVFLFHLFMKIDTLILFFMLLVCKNYTDIVLLLGKALYLTFFTSDSDIILVMWEAIILAISLPLVYLMFVRLLIPVAKRTSHLALWKYLWVLPAFYYIMYRLAIDPTYLDIGASERALTGYLPPFWVFSIFLSYFLLFMVIAEIVERIELDEKLHSARMLTQMQKEQYLMLQNNIEETKRNRHDLKQHFIVLQGLISHENQKEALRYLENCLEQYSIHVKSFCDNYAVDSILRYYAAMAQDHGISMEVGVQLTEELTPPELDFCTMLGNLLANAVEACIRQTSGERFIRLRMGPGGEHMLAIQITNSYSGDIEVQNGVFFSSKREGEGIGTISIRHIVDKYHGILNYDYINYTFQTSILIEISQSEDPKGSQEQAPMDSISENPPPPRRKVHKKIRI